MAKRGQGEGTISKRPDGTWWARITVGRDAQGKQKRKAFYGKTRKEVQEKLTAALNDINNDCYIEPSKMTVSQWLDIWLKDYKINSVKPTTLYNYQKYINYQIKPNIGGYGLKDLRIDMVQRLVNKLVEEGKPESSVMHVINILRSSLKQAIECQMVQKNVALNIKTPHWEKKEMRVLTVEEQERFLEVAKQRYTGKIFILILQQA